MTTKAYSYIRFSSPDQLHGDSLHRQLEASRQYAKEHNLDLDESMQDLGIPAYRGKNKEKGHLGIFLKLVHEGKIPTGTVLIVENLDRLSREKPLVALSQFISIIEAGIKIITLQNGQEYTQDNINDQSLYLSIGEIIRANKESERKSFLISKAWENKRMNISKAKLSSKCPAWLIPVTEQISPTRYVVKDYKVNEDAAAVINLIFDLKLEGKGSEAIARILNASENYTNPNKKRKNGVLKSSIWRKSYVNKILHNNRAVLGEYQPYKLVNGKRVKEGEPIENYYKQIVSHEKYNRVQALIQQNLSMKGFAGGRNGTVSNLFGHLASCQECGYPLAYINKGQTSKGGTYLKCTKEINKVDGGCISTMIRYDIVEENILLYCKGLNVSDILPSASEKDQKLFELNKHLESIKGELTGIDKRLSIVYEEIETATNDNRRNHFKHRAAILEKKKQDLNDDFRQTDIEIKKLSNFNESAKEQLNSIRELIQLMNTLDSQERISLRLNLRTHLRKLIKEIKIDIEQKIIRIYFPSGQWRRIILGAIDPKYKVVDRTKPPKTN